MTIKEIKNFGWPIALLNAINLTYDIKQMPTDIEDTIEYAFKFLSECQRRIIISRYKLAVTYSVIGHELGFSGQKARMAEAEALNTLRKPHILVILQLGKQQFDNQRRRKLLASEMGADEKRKAKLAQIVGIDNANAIIKYENTVGTIEVSSLNLSNRAYTRLIEAKIPTLIELCQITKYEFYIIRLVGKKTFYEIIKEMNRIGIKFRKGEDNEDDLISF